MNYLVAPSPPPTTSKRSWKRIIGTITLAGALVTSAGILGTTASASSPKLSAKLPSIGQMPTEWAIASSSGGSGLGCLANLLEPKGVKQTGSASVDFEDNGNVPQLEENLATFANAKTGYRTIVAALARCRHVAGKLSGHKETGTVGQESFPHYGDASEAFAVSFTVEGTTFGEDLVVVRKGNIVMGIDEGDLAPVDVQQLQGFVVKAMRKLG